MRKFLFDTYQNQNFYAYRLESEELKVVILEYGAIIQSLIDKKSGIDIVQGYEKIVDYINDQDTYLGAIIGRYCNRIEKGSFSFNGRQYQLYLNNNGNTLHGGRVGFNQKVFHSLITDDKLQLCYFSPDGEEGFPGDLKLTVDYYLKSNSLHYDYTVYSATGTIYNITNHSYFNLDGAGTVCEHEFEIPASQVAMIDKNGLTLEEVFAVESTPFDFREGKPLAMALAIANDQIGNAGGIDHHFLVPGSGLRQHMFCRAAKLEMQIESDLPGFHFYTGNFLQDYQGKNQQIYSKRSAFCAETQFYPNNINNSWLPKSILKAGEEAVYHTVYTINLRRES